MSSTCVLSPNPFNTNSSGVSCESPVSTMTHDLLAQQQHPALRGWAASSLASLTSNHLTSLSENYHPMTNEVMRGSLTLLSSTHGPQRVVLSVTRTSVDHFALVYADNRRKVLSVKPVGCINLRGVTCEETVLGNSITGFVLRPKKCDTSSATLIFVCQESDLLPNWMVALSHSTTNNRNIPKTCSLPSLEEEEE